MTIHEDHPFIPPEEDRNAVRRFRGRLAAPVTIWAAGSPPDRVGLTVSSMVISEGPEPRVLGLIDEDSIFAEQIPENFTINVLAEQHRYMADAFAEQVPAPGGRFTLDSWDDSQWGPVLESAVAWCGVETDRLLVEQSVQAPDQLERLGWSLLITGTIAHIEVSDVDPLIHLRGRYRI